MNSWLILGSSVDESSSVLDGNALSRGSSNSLLGMYSSSRSNSNNLAVTGGSTEQARIRHERYILLLEGFGVFGL